MKMSTIASRLLLSAAISLLALAALTSAKQADGVRADFGAKLYFGAPAKGEAPVAAMTFGGQLAWADPQLRLDVVNDQTAESNILLVNFATDSVVLLYPDTLNGTKATLSEFDKSGHLIRISEMLRRQQPKTPEGWQKQDLGKEKLNGANTTHLRYNSADANIVDVWLNAKNQPLRMSISKKETKIVVDVSDIHDRQTIPASTFTYSSDYSLSEFKPGQDKRLSQL